MPLLARLTVAAVMLATAGLAYLSATNVRYDCWTGCHRLWWLIWQEVAEERAGRGLGPVYGQELVTRAEDEVAAGRADARLTDLVRLGRMAPP